MFIINNIFLVINSFVLINAIALDGPSVTRYDPCGLGVIHFDKNITSNEWTGVVDLDKYNDLLFVEIKVQFQLPFSDVWSPESSSIRINKKTRTITVRTDIDDSDTLKFYFKQNGDEVPLIRKLTLNNQILCSDTQRKSFSTRSLIRKTRQDGHYRHVCGRKSLENTEVISFDTEARDGDWPWHVAIFIEDANDPGTRDYQCGGSIIHFSAVLTAGHCAIKNGEYVSANQMILVAGTADISNENSQRAQTFRAKEIILHPSYDNELAAGDLAVIKVNKFTFNEFVQPICIWGPSFSKDELYGEKAMVVGFGMTENDANSDYLRATETQIQEDQTCISYDSDLYTTLLDDTTFCAGYGPDSHVNPRNGDSGAGLVFPEQQNDQKISWFLRGVLSKCGLQKTAEHCDPSFYVVYVDVAPYYDWIFKSAGLIYRENIKAKRRSILNDVPIV